MISRRSPRFGRLAAAAGAVVALSSCGGGDSGNSPAPVAPGPSAPPGATQVTGSERIAWDQRGDLGGLRFRGYLDGNAVALDQAACSASGECVSPLPPMADGLHALSIVAMLPNGQEGSRSVEITLQKVSARSVVSAAFVPAAGSAAPGAAGVLTDASGQTFAIDVVARSLQSPVQMDATADGRLFVSEADGRVSVIHLAAGRRSAPSLEPRDMVRHGRSGPLGLALHPDFSTNRFVYVAFLTGETADQLTLRLVRMREVADALGEPATLFEAPLASEANVPLRAPRLAFGPDRLLYVLLPPGLEFDDQRVASRPHTAMTRLDEDGRVSAMAHPAEATSHPLGFGWHPLTGELWGIVPQSGGNAAVVALDRAGVFALPGLSALPRLALQASPSGDVLAVRQDLSSARTLEFARGIGAENIGTIRLATPIRADRVIEGITGHVADVVGAGDTFYVAVEGYEPSAAPTGDRSTVILRITAQSR